MSFDEKLPWDGVNKSDIQWFFCGNQDLHPTLITASMYWETELPTVLWMSWNIFFNILRFCLIFIILFENSKEEMPVPSINEQTKEQFFLWRQRGRDVISRISPTRSLQSCISLFQTYREGSNEKRSLLDITPPTCFTS